MSKFKYITGTYRDFAGRHAWTDKEVAITFPISVTHSDMERVLIRVKTAGFCHLHATQDGFVEVTAEGRSESLNLDSDQVNDIKLLKVALGLS